MNKFYTLTGSVFLALSCLTASAQTSITEGGTQPVPCGTNIVFTDDDINGPYAPNSEWTITFCPEAGAEDVRMQFVILEDYFFSHVWDVESTSEIYVYDGPDINADLIGVYNTSSAPGGINVAASEDNASGCLTITFVTGDGGAQGFTGLIRCFEPPQPFLVDVTTDPPRTPTNDQDTGYVNICPGDTVTFSATAEYPFAAAEGTGYQQSNETSTFQWILGDGTVQQGENLTTITHSYTDQQGYLATLRVIDAAGWVEQHIIKIRVSTTPTFATLDVRPDTICFGDTITLIGGILGPDTVGFQTSGGFLTGGGIFGDPEFLPDGTSSSYTTDIIIDAFEEGQVIESINDITSMCVNMEHSYLGDLEMTLTCPNGTTIPIFDTYGNEGFIIPGPGDCSGGGTYLGDADDFSADPGEGFDYCFSGDADWGTFCEELADGNTVPVTTGNAMSPGLYTPDGNFEDLLGCPINGTWTITVHDNIGADDGWIFYWSINFNPEIDPNAEIYFPTILEANWSANGDQVVADLDTALVVTPDDFGPQQYTFTVLDDYGCGFDTTITMYVYPPVNAGNNQEACGLTADLQPFSVPGGTGFWEVVEQPEESGEVTFDLDSTGTTGSVSVVDPGDYIFAFTDSTCGYTDSISVYFYPELVEFDVPDTLICGGSQDTLYINQQPEGDDWIYQWSRAGVVQSNDTLLDGVVTGTYTVTVIGTCETFIDTFEVVSVEIPLPDDYDVCGLSTFIDGDLLPEGTGTWTSYPAGALFSDPNDPQTDVTVPEYQDYQFVFKDSRCPNDSAAVNIGFELQPTVDATVLNPEVCPTEFFGNEQGSINYLDVNGVATGTYNALIWTLDGLGVGSGESVELSTGYYAQQESQLVPLTTYSLAFTAVANACETVSDTLNIEIFPCLPPIPNVVSANADGKNDVFNILYLEFFPNTSLRIFNRWGNLIYSNPNFDQINAWNPAEHPAGTYFYELLVPRTDEVITGEITITD